MCKCAQRYHLPHRGEAIKREKEQIKLSPPPFVSFSFLSHSVIVWWCSFDSDVLSLGRGAFLVRQLPKYESSDYFFVRFIRSSRPSQRIPLYFYSFPGNIHSYAYFAELQSFYENGSRQSIWPLSHVRLSAILGFRRGSQPGSDKHGTIIWFDFWNNCGKNA